MTKEITQNLGLLMLTKRNQGKTIKNPSSNITILMNPVPMLNLSKCSKEKLLILAPISHLMILPNSKKQRMCLKKLFSYPSPCHIFSLEFEGLGKGFYCSDPLELGKPSSPKPSLPLAKPLFSM